MTTWQRTTASSGAVVLLVLSALGGTAFASETTTAAQAERSGTSSTQSARCGDPGTGGLLVQRTVRSGNAGSMRAV